MERSLRSCTAKTFRRCASWSPLDRTRWRERSRSTGLPPRVIRGFRRLCATHTATATTESWSTPGRTLLAALAQAFPEAYLDEIDARRLNASQEIATISQLDHPRAAALLRRHSTNRDWLVRYHAVAGLGRHTDPESARALEGALVDVEQMIRDEAARWVQRRDPRRAWLVYEQLLQHKHLAPELRQELERRLITAKRLAARRKR
jgi:hypothetical protein